MEPEAVGFYTRMFRVPSCRTTAYSYDLARITEGSLPVKGHSGDRPNSRHRLQISNIN